MHKQIPRYRPVSFGPGQVDAMVRADGSWIIRSRTNLKTYPSCVGECLVSRAELVPDRSFIAARDGNGGWHHINYRTALETARRIGQALLERDLSSERPLVVLSGNDLEHAMIACACMYVGVPYAAVSPAYSLMPEGIEKLQHVARTLTPGLVFVNDVTKFDRALSAVFPTVEVVATKLAGSRVNTTPFHVLATTDATPAVEAAYHSITQDTIAKFLFTSGSTGLPKAVINTHGMLCAGWQMVRQCWPFIAETPPILVDWLPWHHTFGGNHNFGLVLYNGGTLYIDDGKPTSHGIAATRANLREISPTVYLNIPLGWEEIAHALSQDEILRESFYRRLRMQFFAGASLSQAVWDKLDAIAESHCGERIIMSTGLGMTETSPSAIYLMHEVGLTGQIGVPAPGVELKLEALDELGRRKFEVRYRGPNVTPGYWRASEQTRDAFDGEGFFCSGDVVKWFDVERPSLGLAFDGRMGENFKLNTGT